LDAKGKKMSKSLGNIVRPDEMFEKYGADSVRWYLYTINDPGLPKRFDERELNEVVKKFFMIMWNVVSFHELYPPAQVTSYKLQVTSQHVLDRWILARLNQLTKLVTERLEAYDVTPAARAIQEFVAELSTWYVRRSRERMKEGDEEGRKALRYVLIQLSQLLAPFVPFTADALWQRLGKAQRQEGVEAQSTESVHLSDWPEVQKIDEDVLSNMDSVRKIVEAGLAARAAAKMPIRQPLRGAKIKGQGVMISEQYIEIVKDELNVKGVTWENKQGETLVELDTELDEELKLEGMKRELIRAMNNLRKEAKLTINDRVTLQLQSGEATIRLWEQSKEEIAQAVHADNIVLVEGVVNGEKTGKVILGDNEVTFGW